MLLGKNNRVPADMVLLRTSGPSGTCSIRTDQLNGETDWKAQVAVSMTQGLKGGEREVTILNGEVYHNAPIKDIYNFVGTLTVHLTSDSGLGMFFIFVPLPTRLPSNFLSLMLHANFFPKVSESTSTLCPANYVGQRDSRYDRLPKHTSGGTWTNQIFAE